MRIGSCTFHDNGNEGWDSVERENGIVGAFLRVRVNKAVHAGVQAPKLTGPEWAELDGYLGATTEDRPLFRELVEKDYADLVREELEEEAAKAAERLKAKSWYDVPF